MLFGMCALGAGSMQTVPYVASASSEGHAGLVRIEGRFNRCCGVGLRIGKTGGERERSPMGRVGDIGTAGESRMQATDVRGGREVLAGWRARAAVALAVSCGGLPASGSEAVHTVPYLPPASAVGHAGVVRIQNRSDADGVVELVAIDDIGDRREAVVVPLGAREVLQFEAQDLEEGLIDRTWFPWSLAGRKGSCPEWIHR